MILQSFANLFKIPELRIKLAFTAFFLFIFRLGSQIPIPGLDLEVLRQLEEKGGFGAGGIFSFVSVMTGGALGNCSLFSLGIMPYISASIIFSLLAKIVPSLEALSKEGPSGYRKINEYTRWATVPLCIIQAIMIVQMFDDPQRELGGNKLVNEMTIQFFITAVVALTAGAIFLMWLGEQINEYGIGNGISLLIMGGIVARMPHQVEQIIRGSTQQESGQELLKFFFLLALFLFMVAGVVYMTYGQRKIMIQQAKQTRGRRVYGGRKHAMPLRVNQAGVMPVIFASSLMVFPMAIATAIGMNNDQSDYGWFGWGSASYMFTYIIFIYFFSYFWTSLMFQPTEMANQLKEYGSFILGIRPGEKTAEYLEGVMTRITFVGAAFLTFIALIPQVSAMLLGLHGANAGFVYNLGGTSILIVVGVILDVAQKLESHLLTRHYEGFSKNTRMRGR